MPGSEHLQMVQQEPQGLRRQCLPEVTGSQAHRHGRGDHPARRLGEGVTRKARTVRGRKKAVRHLRVVRSQRAALVRERARKC